MEPAGCTIGRPLRVDDEIRVATLQPGSDWIGAEQLNVAALTAAERHALAAQWTQIAQMEHASVASFARCTLDLMTLGAPPELIRDTQKASIDEVNHARSAFAIAAALHGTPRSPGPLNLDNALACADLQTFLARLVHEACIGETVGAAMLAAAATDCLNPGLGSLLKQTGDDETRHAALGWRTLKWLLTEHPHLRTSIQAHFADGVRLLRSELGAPQTEAIAGWGTLPREARIRVFAQTTSIVIEPALALLLSSNAPKQPALASPAPVG